MQQLRQCVLPGYWSYACCVIDIVYVIHVFRILSNAKNAGDLVVCRKFYLMWTFVAQAAFFRPVYALAQATCDAAPRHSARLYVNWIIIYIITQFYFRTMWSKLIFFKFQNRIFCCINFNHCVFLQSAGVMGTCSSTCSGGTIYAGIAIFFLRRFQCVIDLHLFVCNILDSWYSLLLLFSCFCTLRALCRSQLH